VQKPDALTIFGWSDDIYYIYLYIKVLAPAFNDQFIPVFSGQGHWLFQHRLRAAKCDTILLEGLD
jgi:hypothetical protein